MHSREDLGNDSYQALGVYRDGLVMAGSRQRIDFCLGALRLESRRFLRGHEDEILSLSVSPDAKWWVSCGKDRSIRLWKIPGQDGTDEGQSLPIPSVRCHGPDGMSFLGETAPGNVYFRRREGELIKVEADKPRYALTSEECGLWLGHRGDVQSSSCLGAACDIVPSSDSGFGPGIAKIPAEGLDGGVGVEDGIPSRSGRHGEVDPVGGVGGEGDRRSGSKIDGGDSGSRGGGD